MFSEKQGYDRGTTIFSPDGRLYQVEYARRAVEQGSPAIGVRIEDAVVMVATAAPRSPLVTGGDIDKLHRIDEHLLCVSAGHAADARHLIDKARAFAQEDYLQYGDRITVDALATAIGDYIQNRTQAGGVRPFGASLLVGGVDTQSALFEIDPSGAILEWGANAIGGHHEALREHFEDRYDNEFGREEALTMAISGLYSVDAETSPRDMRAGILDEDGFEDAAAQLADVIDTLD